MQPEVRSTYTCLVLRRRHMQYIDVLPDTVDVSSAFFADIEADRSDGDWLTRQGDLRLCLDLEDAAVLALRLAKQREGEGRVGASGEETIVFDHFGSVKQRASSFALWTPDGATGYTSPHRAGRRRGRAERRWDFDPLCALRWALPRLFRDG